MRNRKLDYAINFFKALNKYLIISWSVFILVFSVYLFGFENIAKKGPFSVYAEGEGDEWGVSSDWSGGSDSDEVSEPEPIRNESAKPARQPESDEVAASEPISSEPDAVLEEPVPNGTANFENNRESDEVSAPEPLIDSSSPEVSVVSEPTPTPQPTPTPYQAPVRVIEREVVREVVRHDNDDDKDDDRNSRRTPTSTPTPTPTLTPTPTPTLTPTPTPTLTPTPTSSPSPTLRPSPSTPTTTTIINGKTYDDVVRVVRPGEAGAVCGGGATTIVTKTVTVCDKSEVQGQQVLAAIATPTPFPSPSPSLSPSPTPGASVSPSPSLRPSPSPSQTSVIQTPQIRVVTSQDVLTIPVRQETVCPAGSTRTAENDQQIICQVNVAQVQGQAQSQTKQIVLTGVGTAATTSAAPKVITQVQTPIKELPNTGLPAAAVGFGALVPLGLGLRKYTKGDKKVSANSLWFERQLKN